ncbi:MAG TPA: 3-phosphoshikimate 1-carboxyvinyltransferase [Phycisphaerae bacterium]|nr:3-phosphoshikimate 1-carboxyvinyltransferase [Phycisphaerae bacterium]HPS52461.1 3-phosphoshikimate 1-carboxyvinyltransferase [Phycisphaerae bacterium]
MKKLSGKFTPPGDKSISHRIALFALAAEGSAAVTNYSPCDDCTSSLNAVKKLGCTITQAGDALIIHGAANRHLNSGHIDCGNSGTTMRLLCGLLAGRIGRFELDGDQYLRRRPMERIVSPLKMMGGELQTTNGKCPITVTGESLEGIEYELPVASAQLKSAILLAGLTAKGTTTIIENIPSRDHTERMLKAFGAEIFGDKRRIILNPSQIVLPEKFAVPADASSAAFFLCTAAITPGSDVTATGMLLNPTRCAFLDVLKRMGADVTVTHTGDSPEPVGDVRVKYSPNLLPTTIEPAEIPLVVDEIPILALTACCASGCSVFKNAGELRVKECDRLAAIQSQLNRMGAEIEITPDDSLIITGKTEFKGGIKCNSMGDHRIAMVLRCASLLADDDIEISDEKCVSVSYPNFHSELERLTQ